MSKLGIVVELRNDLIGDETRRTKQKYPIVYENGTYYYCKEYGSDILVIFSKVGTYSRPVISYDTFQEHRAEYLTKNSTIYVKVDKFSDDKFAEWCDPRILYDIDRLKSEIYREEKTYNSVKHEYEFDSEYLKKAEPRIAKLKTQLEELLKQLEEDTND